MQLPIAFSFQRRFSGLFVPLLLAALLVGGGARAFDLKRVEGSVFKVYTWRLNAKKGVSSGTGFLVSGHRILISNYHVVANGERYFVGYRDGRDGKLVEARVVELRSPTDLAVLEAYEDLPGKALALGDYEPEKLANVVAVGFPGAADVKENTQVRSVPELLQVMREPSGFDPTITPGTVSRIYSATNAALGEAQVLNARTVQHNAAINPGNSGGPLFDACAAVIGVNSFFPKGAQGVFFSIHSAEVIRLLHDLNISYATVSRPCLSASFSGGGGLLLPLLIAMSAMLAIAALLFALRHKSNPLAVISQYAGRFSRLGRTAPLAGERAPAPRGWASVHHAISLMSTDGDRGYTLEGGKALIVGRGKQCEIVIADDTVSITHARLEFDAQNQWVAVSDLGSSNGTFHNGRRITSAQARPGDTLCFGNADFRLAAGSASGPEKEGVGQVWMLSGFDPAGRALQFELRPIGNAGTAGATWTIGRDPGRAQFVIDDSSVSGVHAEISYVPQQGLSLRDLGSTNGTRVDGDTLGAHAVALEDTGQEITFGVAKLRLSRLAG
jgi:pSer/pThr/pTyr-binding forkhead associated (FHA) protein/S1-C subfamily serine protease